MKLLGLLGPPTTGDGGGLDRLGFDTSILAPPEDIDPLADGIPDTLADAERQLAPALAEFLDAGAAGVVIPLLMIALFALIVGLFRRQLTAPPDAPSPGPPAAAAAMICLGLYAFGRAIDPLMASLLSRPSWFPEDTWAQVGWFEWKLLGRPWAWGALPLEAHPGLALVVHAVVWGGLWFVLRFVLDWIWAAGLRWSAPTVDLPWYFRWVGSSTTRRADQRFRHWLGWALLPLIPMHALAGLRLAEHPGVLPAPGAWVTGGLLLWTITFHLLVTGKPPAPKEGGESDDDDREGAEGQAEVEAGPARVAPLTQLRRAVEAVRPGFELEALVRRDPTAGERAPFPESTAPLVREIFTDLTAQTQPWAHQAELLAHLGATWSLHTGRERGEVPTLEEEHGGGVIRRSDDPIPHALVLAPEGSGRTTSTVLAALHVYFDRGATTLVIVRDRGRALRWASRLAEALAGSSARWNVLVSVAGQDLAQTLVAERTPAIVVADLESCESEVLCDARTDDFLARLGLIIADDVDGFTGVAEMHLQMCVRRLWALLDRLHEAAYPVALLATAGPGAGGMDAWAKHVLAVPMRTFAEDTAATRAQVLLRRRDLVDGAGVDIPLDVLIRACDRAGLPWHLRQAGDRTRGVRRAAFDLGSLRRHHREDPREAAIVIVEGTYPDVRREARRLVHAGVALDGAPTDDRPGFPARAPAVLVLAPPGDEEMVLHEEAEDAAHRKLVDGLPRAVPLFEPRVVRQRHFDRAVGREQDLLALRDRFGARFVDETVAELGEALRHREILHIDPASDEIQPRKLLRTVKEGALGQPIDARCVGDRDGRTSVVDAGTSEVLAATDTAVARAQFPPGRIFMHPRGRYMVVDHHGNDPRAQLGDGVLAAEQIGGRERTTVDRSIGLQLADHRALEWADRQFSGRTLPVALTHATIREHLHGMRRFAPGPELVDHRIYERPIEATYGTDLCLVATGADPRGLPPTPVEGEDPGHAREQDELSAEVLIPLTAALRMILPCYLRAGGDLVDVDFVELDGLRLLAIFDRTPGGSGFARYVCERGLKDLLVLARLVLERLVGNEFARLRHIHDRTPESDPARWRIGEALRWLDAVLDSPPREDAPAAAEAGGPRVVYTPGEGHGDLGRMWISRTGRTDDLVWTRHTWWSPVAIGECPKGKVFFDVAVERPAIAAARRRAMLLAGQELERSERLDLDSSAAHGQLIAAERADLEPIRDQLAELCGDVFIDTVLALVAAIPITAHPMTVADRGPLAVLARRRADVDAKLLLACALLPASAEPEVLVGPPPEEAAWLRIQRDGAQVWDLRGPHPVRVDAEPAERATLVLDGRA